MKKITILLLFYFISFGFIKSQIILFDFNVEPYLKVTNTNSKIRVSELTLSSGAISTNITTGTYFIDEPYVQESGGWAAVNKFDAKYFYIDIAAIKGYRFSISNISFNAYSTSAGPSAISVLLNNNFVFGNDMPNSEMQFISNGVSDYSNLTHITLKIAGWDNASRLTSGSGILKLDNLVIDGEVEPIPLNDSSSVITTTQFVSPSDISSVINSPKLLPVMEIVILDSASGDGLKTFVDSLVFMIDTLSFTNWDKVVDEVKLVSTAYTDTVVGEVKDGRITFVTQGLLNVNEGVLVQDTCRLLVNLHTVLPNIDGVNLKLLLDSTHIYCNPLGSQIGWGTVESNPNKLSIQVKASKINVAIDDLPIWKGSVFNIQVKAVDINGNIDNDEFGEVKLKHLIGKGVLQTDNLLTSNFKKGICEFVNLVFTSSDTMAINIISDKYSNCLIDSLLVSELLFYDDFSNSNLSQWNNIDDWQVCLCDSVDSSYNLKHNLDDVGGVSYIASKYRNINMDYGKVAWNITLKNGDFDPTSSNKFWYYIMSSNNNLISDNNYGYVVGVNFLGSSDTLSLWKIDTLGNKSIILQTDFNWESNSSVDIEVVREPMGIWQIGYINNAASKKIKYTERVEDNSFIDLPYHGLVYKYSSTRAGLLWCNNINIGMLNTAPKLINAKGISNSIVELLFSEPLKQTEVGLIGNYILISDNDETVSIDRVTFDTNFPNKVLLEVNRLKTANYVVEVSNLLDAEGCVMPKSRFSFNYYVEVELYDIVFNEIMANPEPTVGLPNVEYIEIYNNTKSEIWTFNCILKVNNSICELPNITIQPNSYMVLCDIESVLEFDDTINVVGVSNLPILPLSGTILLINSHDKLICKTKYSSSWIVDDFKADGGFSIERINYSNSDETSANWKVSDNIKGGTPGSENSIYENISDNTSPDLLRAFPVNDSVIGLQFTEAMNIYKMLNSMIDINNEIDVRSMFVLDYNLSVLYLHLSASLLVGVEYFIELSSDITDIAGNNIINNTAKIMLPTQASPNDVVINEVLFNPLDGSVDFVELYNRSAFTVNLKQLIVASFDDVGNIKYPKYITSDGVLLFPSSYVVVSENSNSIKEKYWVENELCFVDMEHLPTFSSNDGSVVIIDTNGVVIDYMYYTDDMHFGLLNDTKGVSLERVDYNRSSQDNSNWHSASEQSGWATPGYKNSMYNNISKNGGVITIDPKAFSPDSDGFDDVLYIHYKFTEPGNVAKVSIYDKVGRQVVVLADNELMSVEGVLAWDGLDKNNQKSPIGIYVIFIEVFDLNGNIKKYKRVCAINTRFN